MKNIYYLDWTEPDGTPGREATTRWASAARDIKAVLDRGGKINYVGSSER